MAAAIWTSAPATRTGFSVLSLLERPRPWLRALGRVRSTWFVSLIGAVAVQAAPSPSSTQVPLGAGLEPIVDWARSNVFVDVVKQSRGFGPPNSADPSTVIPADAHGCPRGDFGIILWTSAAKVHGLGVTSKLSCNGRARIARLASDAEVRTTAFDARTNTTTADVVVSEGSDNLFLSFTGTTTGVQNLKVLRPGYRPSDTFSTPLKKHLARFSVLRFMDWANTNNNPVQHWS